MLNINGNEIGYSTFISLPSIFTQPIVCPTYPQSVKYEMDFHTIIIL